MTTCGEEIQVQTRKTGEGLGSVRRTLNSFWRDNRVRQVVATVFTTFSVYGIYLIQGVIIARILGATARGEFGTALYFPRELLLWPGLLGAVEIVTAYATRFVANKDGNPVLMKYSAARLGLITGVLTAFLAALLSLFLLIPTGKSYLIPYCLFCCVFVPFEHIHLTISSVDKGTESFRRYNINRLVFAAAFPILMVFAWLIQLNALTGIDWLALTCVIWVFAKVVGLLPTLRGMGLFSSQRKTYLSDLGIERDKGNVPGCRRLLKEGRPFAVSVFIAEVFYRLDLFLILAIATVTEAGYYLVAIPAAGMLVIAPNALGVFTFNAGARKDVVVTRKRAAQILGFTAVFQIVSTIIFALVIGKLIVFFFSEEYAPAIPFALWLLPASAMKGFQQVAEEYLKGVGKPLIGVRARVIGILAMIVGVSLLFGSKGIISIPIAACIGQSVSLIIITASVFLNVDQSDVNLASNS